MYVELVTRKGGVAPKKRGRKAKEVNPLVKFIQKWPGYFI
jgi:hypothetical protein